MKDWIATLLGLGGGLSLAYLIAGAALPRLVERTKRPQRMVRFAFGGAVIALLPALLLSVLLGAVLGSAWGAAGTALGVAAVFALVLLAGTLAGVALAYFT